MTPKQDRLPIVGRLRSYFDAMALIGPTPDAIHMWPEQMDLLLKHNLARMSDPYTRRLDDQDFVLMIDGLPCVRLMRYVEVDERSVA